MVQRVGQVKPRSDASAVERTADAIAYNIVAGRYRAGERLPSVRDLARVYGINASTVQVALARLQESGFVTAHPRLGFVVRDIEQLGGIGTWRYVFRFAQQLPDRTLRICEELLEMRRVLMAEAIQKIADHPKRYDAAPVRRAVERLEMVAASTPRDTLEIARAEFSATRLLMLAAGQSVVTAVLNSIAEIYLEVPVLVDALYADPKRHIAQWHALLAAWERSDLPEQAGVEVRRVLRRYDVTVLDRLRERLASRRPRRKSA
jgi:DNA-binding FadR family transcriptional regulator